MRNIGLKLGFGEGPFSPKSIQGLATWCRADHGIHIGTGVSQWDDISGVGDSNRNFAQVTGSKQPTLNTSDAAYNNQPTVSFVSASQQYLQSGAWTLGSGNTIFIVGNMDGVASPNQAFYDASPGSPHEQVIDIGAGNWTAASTAAMAFGTYNGNKHVLGMIWNGNNSFGYDNTKIGQSGNTGTGGATGLVLGTYQGVNALFLNGKIAEFIVYNRALSNNEIGQVMTYAGKRYNITIAG